MGPVEAGEMDTITLPPWLPRNQGGAVGQLTIPCQLPVVASNPVTVGVGQDSLVRALQTLWV